MQKERRRETQDKVSISCVPSFGLLSQPHDSFSEAVNDKVRKRIKS